MRIAVWHNLPSGGGKRALFNQVKGLLSRGHEVEAWCPPTADSRFLRLDAMIQEHVVDLEWPIQQSWTDKIGLSLLVEREIAAMDLHCRACAAEINSGQFDILFANCCTFFRTTSIGRFSDIPAVIYLGEPYRWLYEAMPRLRWLAGPRRSKPVLAPSSIKYTIRDFRSIGNWRVQAREEVDNAAAFDRILVNSYFSRESVLRSYGYDSQVCYLGVDTQLFHDSGVERQNLLVGVGSFTREKNVQLCIEAIASISGMNKPKLVWIGNVSSNEYLESMCELARQNGVEFDPRINVSDEELVSTLNSAFAMLYAPRLEPFGLAPLEANACGVPVIAVAEGGVRETLLDGVTGLLVENDPLSMASAIVKLMEDQVLAQNLRKSSRSHVESEWNITKADDRLEQTLMTYSKLKVR